MWRRRALSCSCVCGSTDMQPTRRMLAPQNKTTKLDETNLALTLLKCTQK